MKKGAAKRMAIWQALNMPRRALRFLKPGDTEFQVVSFLGRGLGGILYKLQAGHHPPISPSSPALPAFLYEV